MHPSFIASSEDMRTTKMASNPNLKACCVRVMVNGMNKKAMTVRRIISMMTMRMRGLILELIISRRVH